MAPVRFSSYCASCVRDKALHEGKTKQPPIKKTNMKTLNMDELPGTYTDQINQQQE